MAAYKERIDRLAMLVTLIPVHLAKEDCPDPGRLLTSMAEQYDLRASRRAIQRDLEALVKEGRIAVVNPGGKPLRYRRLVDADAVDLRMWDYARQLMGALIRDALPERRLERIWAKLREEGDEFGLGEDKLCILSDTQRLLPADIREDVLAATLEALSLSQTLQAAYRDREGKLTRPTLHPQALLQRGPRLYLFALKNDEAEPVRMYALHRFISAKLGDGAARISGSFNLQSAVRKGQVDFAGDHQVALELRVRGYVAELLRDTHLAIARAGASTVAELATIGRPSILVPLPGAIDDHQRANAAALAQPGGAILVDQATLTPAMLAHHLATHLASGETLARAATAAATAGRPDAAARLADLVETAIARRASKEIPA